MLRYILLALGSFGLINYAECAITGWTNPSASGDDVTGNCGSVAEDGTLSITVAATSDGVDGAVIAGYTIAAQHTGYTFAITNAGVITKTAGTFDFETAPTLTFSVHVEEVAGTPAGTATCMLTITDVNEAAPVFSPSTVTVSTADNVAAGTAVTSMFTATDADTANTITYAITGGNTNSDLALDTSTGAITVATGKTLVKASTAYYILTITATDNGSPAMTGTGTLTVCVDATTCGNAAAAIAVSVLTLMTALLASL